MLTVWFSPSEPQAVHLAAALNSRRCKQLSPRALEALSLLGAWANQTHDILLFFLFLFTATCPLSFSPATPNTHQNRNSKPFLLHTVCSQVLRHIGVVITHNFTQIFPHSPGSYCCARVASGRSVTILGLFIFFKSCAKHWEAA